MRIRSFLKGYWLWILVVVFAGFFSFQGTVPLAALVDKTTSYIYGMSIRRNPNIAPSAYLEHETVGVLNLALTEAGIGDLRPTGVTKSMPIQLPRSFTSEGTTSVILDFSTQWVIADSDAGIWLNGDAILDSMSVFANPTGTDSLIILTYKTTAVATLISTDTLIYSSAGYQTVDYTGVAAGTRDLDISAGEFPAFHVTEVGTVASVTVIPHFREYDAQ